MDAIECRVAFVGNNPKCKVYQPWANRATHVAIPKDDYERLTRERDEARAEVERLRETHQEACDAIADYTLKQGEIKRKAKIDVLREVRDELHKRAIDLRNHHSYRAGCIDAMVYCGRIIKQLEDG